MIFLLSKPYTSDFLLETIKSNQYQVVATEEAVSIACNLDLNWISEKEAVQLLENDSSTRIYTNSENALDWIAKHLGKSKLYQQITSLKDKVKFRRVIKTSFPKFQFREMNLEEIHFLDMNGITFPCVIKPAIGFFSIGVHVVNNKEEWETVKRLLTPSKLKSIFPESVLNTAKFMMEDYITGEEYAIDYYYDRTGEVIILNILHHVFSSGSDTSDRVYTTSKEIIQSKEEVFKEVLQNIGSRIGLKSFPAHAELRISEDGIIIPIEINPMRFGGWCTTADLMGMGIGYNPYIAFAEGGRPDWDSIFKGKEDKLYSIIVLDNNSGIEVEDIDEFDYNQLVSDFEKPLVMRKMDISKNPVFGFLFTETSKDNEEELRNILTSDLRKYIKTKDLGNSNLEYSSKENS